MFALLLSCSLAAAPAPQQRVYVGVFLNDVSDFDLKAGRFKADLRVWLKWQGDAKVPELSFENAEVDSKDDLGAEEESGWHSVQWRVQGTFRGEFPVHDFPFDRQTLPIVFGLDERDGVLVPDLGASGMSPSFSVTGWKYEPFFEARSQERVYRSDLGSVAHEGVDAKQRLTTYSVEVSRPFGPYLIKFALPLALILLVALLALFLPPERLDVRSAMGITGLLSCIAFHYTQADTLPAVTYLVAADKLFLAAYVFVTVTLVLSVLSFRLNDRRPVMAKRADRLGTWLLPVATVVGLGWMVSGAFESRLEVEQPAPKSLHPTQPVLRVAVQTLDTMGGSSLPARRGALVTRRADGSFRPDLVHEAPAMTNALVRLLPDGGMRVRWQLRSNATWSDGAPITADDLVFSLTAQPDPLRTSVERLDARTIDVTYTDRRAELLAGFTVFPKSALQLKLDGGRDALNLAHNEGKLAMSGPYVAGEFVQGKSLVLLRNEKAAMTKPAFERVEVKVLAPLDAAKALLAGEVDVVPSLTPDAYELLKNAKGVKVLEQPGDLLWVVVPPLSTAPWSSLEARRALLSAIRRDELVKALAPAPSQVASGWLPEKERSLAAPTLETLGLKGTAVTLFVQTIRSKDATHAVLAARLVEDLTNAGLVVQVVEKNPTELRQEVNAGTLPGLALLSRDTADPARFMNLLGDGGRTAVDKPVGAHFDQVMVEKLARAKGTLYVERQRGLGLDLQAAWFERLPMLPLVLTSRLAAVREGLEGPDWGVADSLWWNLADWHFSERSAPAAAAAQPARPSPL